jgi:ATP-binding cassette subfamily F protein uup
MSPARPAPPSPSSPASAWPDRPQRCRQVFAAEDPGRTGAPRRRHAATAAGPARVYVPQEPQFDAGPRCSTPWPRRGRGTALRERYEAHAPATTWTPADPPGGAGRLDLGAARGRGLQRLRLEPDARVDGLSGGTRKRVALAQALVARPTCCCSTSPPTTSTWTPSSGCRTCCWAGVARWCSSRTTAPSSTRGHPHRRARPRPAAQLPRQLRAYEPAKERELEPRRWPTPAPTSCWRRRRSGSARAWRRGARAAWPRGAAGQAARTARRAPRHAGPGAAGARRRPAARQDRGRAEDVSMPLRPARIVIDRFSATMLRGDKVGLIGPNGAARPRCSS